MREVEYPATWSPPDLLETVQRSQKSQLKSFNRERSKSLHWNSRISSLQHVAYLERLFHRSVCFHVCLYLYSHYMFSSQWPLLETTVLTFSGLRNCVKKNQLDAQTILSKFRQPLHVSGVSRHIIRRYSRMYTKIGTCYSF